MIQRAYFLCIEVIIISRKHFILIVIIINFKTFGINFKEKLVLIFLLKEMGLEDIHDRELLGHHIVGELLSLLLKLNDRVVSNEVWLVNLRIKKELLQF